MKIKKLFLLNLLLLCGFIIMSGCKSCKKESNKKEDPFLASFSNYLETRKNTDTSFIFKNPVKTLDFIFEVLSKNESPFIRGQVQKGLVFTNNKNLKEWMGVSNKCPMMGFLPPNIPGIQFELFYCSENPQRIIKDHKLKKVSEHLWKHEKELYFSYQNNIVLISTKIIDPLTFKELSTSKQKIPKDYLTDQEIFIFPRYSSKDKTEIESTLKIIAKTEAKNFKGKLIVDKIKNPQKVYDPNLANSWSYLSKHPMVKAFLLLPINF